MCGIVGIVSNRPVPDRERLRTQRDTMHHRGPDDSGIWWSQDGRAGFGHCRLSIIDLSAMGHQPMLDEGNGLCIVLNGEIYNYQELRLELSAKGHVFRSQSDTEVVLSAYKEWGTDCLSRLNGMFSFAIYDRMKQHVFMARDRAGEKPLFYSLSSGTLRFASELKGIMADPEFPRWIYREALDCYLAMGYVLGERCILQGVKKLPPAHAMLFDMQSGQGKGWRYWQLPALKSPTIDEHTLLNELEVLLQDSVCRQLVADVPVGILLSGGVDSSLVTAMAVRAKQKIRTFTVRFPGSGSLDETGHARLIARHFATEHTELDAGELSVNLLPLLARQFDEPIADSSMIPTYLVSRLIKEHCTVAIGGDGGDELFGGYGHYNRLMWLEKNLGGIPYPVRRLIARGAEALLPVGFKGRNWLQGSGMELKHDLPLIAAYFDRRSREQLIVGSQKGSLIAENVWSERTSQAEDLLQRATRTDFENYLAEDILVKVDRSSMLCALEVRAPMLDYRLCEFAFSKVPSHLKATATSRKVLLKRLAARVLPSGFDLKRKQGFSIPLSSWLKSGPWLTFFREVLLDSKDTFFNRQVVSELFAGQAQGRSNSERLFVLVLFELWRREYKVVMS